MPKTSNCPSFVQERFKKQFNHCFSILSCLSKQFERAFYDRVNDFLDKHDLLYEKELGFRARRSTVHALIEIKEDISKKDRVRISSLGSQEKN